MGLRKIGARRQKLEGIIGAKTVRTAMVKGTRDELLAMIDSLRYTGGPIRSTIFPPLSSSCTVSSSAAAAAASTSAGVVRNPTITPQPQPLYRRKPKIATSSPSPPSPRDQESSASSLVVEAKEMKKPSRAPRKQERTATTNTTTDASLSNNSSRKRKKKGEQQLAEDTNNINTKKRAKHDDEKGKKLPVDGDLEDAKTHKKRSCQLTATESRSEAYKRALVYNQWKPPTSPYQLLQEGHCSDPWRVLVICILLNRTSGVQVRPMLKDFFELCPDAETAKDVCDEKLMQLIKPLGLYRLRTRSIKRFSREYLENGWTHVTQLHGVGKYAADAYAIFCGGKPEKVKPDDHKLVPYWEFVSDLLAKKRVEQPKLVQSQVDFEAKKA